ncbi:Neprilysin-1 [Lamellibrachia satsuma]|nr:Neprilysin-1 [Lamellibrachia satsuma]
MNARSLMRQHTTHAKYILGDTYGVYSSLQSASTVMTWLDDVPRGSDKKTWWSRRTLLEVKLTILILLLFLVAVVMVVISAFNSGRTRPADVVSTTPCMKEECIMAASQMLRVRNTAVDPCDDFYEYACGRSNEEYNIPSDTNAYSSWTQLRSEIAVKLKRVLEKPILSSEPNATKKAKMYYQSCMDTERIESEGPTPVLRLVKKLGGWPALDSRWNSSRFDFVTTMGRIIELGLGAAFVSPFPTKTTGGTFRILVQPARLTLERAMYVEKKHQNNLAAYTRFAVAVMKAFGASQDTVNADVKDIIDFEVKVAKLMYLPDERYTTYTTTPAELSEDFPFIDWHRYLNSVYGVVNIAINSTDDIFFIMERYFEHLGPLIASTPKRTVANFMLWTVFSRYTNILSREFRYANRKLDKEFGNRRTTTNQWRICVDVVRTDLYLPCSRIFVQEYFDDSAKLDTEKMVATIRQTFTEMLEDVSWMGTDMKHKAKEKADAMIVNIGYPESIYNNTFLDSAYEQIEIESDQYFANIIQIIDAYFRRALLLITMKQVISQRSSWNVSPTTVNAFNYRAANRIEFPAAVLQPPFYHKDYPKSLNYGRIGYLIGHEIVHGFDNEGRRYDKNGVKRNWWSACSAEKFQKNAQCMVEQYDSYIIPELGTPVNGTITLDENIADSAGLKQSFQAYQKWLRTSNTKEHSLPGVDLNNNQLFFFSYAQLWCVKGRKAFYKMMSKNVHSPERFRVIGTLSNSEDFAKAYSCPVGSRMNPAKKCSVW